MSITDNSNKKNLDDSSNIIIYHPQTNNFSTTRSSVEKTKSFKSCTKKIFENSRSSDSGKSSSCSPILLDCSFDSGIAGILVDNSDMQLHKRIQQWQCILLALERDREYFFSIRHRLSKISNRKKKESNENEFFCNVCCTEIDTEDEKTLIKCYICEKYICRSNKCANWLPNLAKWECELCESSKESLAQTSSWVADQITFHQEKLFHPPRARSEIYIPISECNDSSIHFESVSQIDANSTAITAEQKLKIREYVEKVVASLLGGNLDKIAVNQLSKSENYLPDPQGDTNYNGRMSRESVPLRSSGTDFTDISETRLRQMIQKIIAETMNLPSFSNGHALSEISLDRRSKVDDNRQLSNGFHQRHRAEHYFEPIIYQDLLATAVLNKIVDKRLNNNQEISGNDTTGCDYGGVMNADNEVNDNVRLAESDRNFNNEKLSTTSGSSVEPQSDCSFPEIEQIFNTTDDKSSDLLRNSDRDSVMSEYLASHLIPLPDLNAMTNESDEDDYMSVTSSAIGDGTWEKNWLFKKKRTTLSGSVTGNSGVMLVPDPKEDVRAQIGDKTTDEISDLSELGSDTDDSLDSLRSKLEPINDRLINKHLIGGQNSKIILDELIERSSMISNILPNSQDQIYADACNEHVVDAPTKNEAINNNVTQQKNTIEQNDSVVLNNPSSNTLTGSIAEREYKKWYNAVEMPNNPYAPEALKRRISSSQERFIDLPNISPTKDINTLELLNSQKIDVDENVTRESDYKRYSRDYYINSSLTTPQMSPSKDVTANVVKDNREVNNNDNNINQNYYSYQNKSRKEKLKHNSNDYHWTLSTPVRRSSSLKYLNYSINSPSPTHLHIIPPPTYHQHNRSSYILPKRPSTSTSFYNYFKHLHNDNNYDNDDENQLNMHSHRSWKSSSALNTKRKTVSMLSLFSAESSCSNITRYNRKENNVLTQFEKQLLHKDLKRNSFRAVSSTTKDFVLNPLYEKDQSIKLSIVKPLTQPEEKTNNQKSVDNILNTSIDNGDDQSKQNYNTLLF